MPSPPFVPMLTGDTARDIEALHAHLLDLNAWLAEGEPDSGWSTSGLSTDKVLASGDTLAATQNVLASLIEVLKVKGVLSA
jgi:hypothetical protein